MKKPIECYFTLSGINYKNGFITSCPQTPDQFVQMSDTIKPSEAFNSEAFKQHRLEMMGGTWSRGCHLCRDPEKIGSHSMRQDYIPVLEYYDTETGEVSTDGLKTIELRFSNSCNMACKHCSVVYSSGWVSKLKNYTPDEEDEKHDLKQLLKSEHRETDNDSGELGLTLDQVKEIVDDLNANCPNLEKVEFAGGEVLHQKQFLPCLKMLADHPNAKNIFISFHTNFNAKFDPVELSEALKPFKDSLIHISVDSGTNIYSYFRTGDWEVLKQNIEKFKLVDDKTYIGLVNTTSIYQMLDLKNIFKSYLELDIDVIDCSMVYSPLYLNPSLITVEFKDEVIKDIEDTRKMLEEEQQRRMDDFENTKNMRAWSNYHRRFKDITSGLKCLSEIENYVLNNFIEPKYWEDFLVYVRKTDQIWKQDFNEYFPNYKFENNRIRRVDNV